MTRDRAVSTLLAAVFVGAVAYDAAALPWPWGALAGALCAGCAVLAGACVAIARTD